MSQVPGDSSSCKLCKGLAENHMTINIGALDDSASSTNCEGCVFLLNLADVTHNWMHGAPLDDSQIIFVNYGLLHPPKEFLILPFGNVMAQMGKVEIFKTSPRGDACPWPTIKQATLTSGDTGSEKCHDTIATWLRECVSSHSSCKLSEEPYLPTRVLDLGDMSTGNASVSLLEAKSSQRGEYCCLSHRWVDGNTPTTTASNLEEHKNGIELSQLPSKYQGAIAFTRKLGIRYLWIDSLCIIQESSTDWTAEAPKMAQYYGNAHLTISASTSISKGQGIFSKTKFGTGTLNIGDGTKLLYAVHYRIPLQHTESPLHSRGWVFQEYMLSRRVVHFLEHEVVWECREAIRCECSRVDDDFEGTLTLEPIAGSAHQSFAYRQKRRFYEKLYNSPSPMRLRNVWMEVVHEYSLKKLTFASDVFPAIAGLAKEMQKQRKCEYYAGLWQDTLISDLLWQAEDPEWYPEGYKYAKPDKWRAPSWSWASSTAVINWPSCCIDSTTGEFKEMDLIGEVFVRDVQVKCKASGEDAFMGLEAGELSVIGTLSTTPLVRDDKKGYDVLEKYGSYSLSLDHTMTEEELVDPILLRSVLVANILVGQRDNLVSLILRPTGRNNTEFERIGLMHHSTRLREVEKDLRLTIV